MTSESASNVAAQICAFIASRFPAARGLNLGDEESLLDAGVVDSLGVLDLVTFIHDAFGIQVEDGDLSRDNFGSVAALVRLVLRKR